MTELTKEQKQELRKERRSLLNDIRSRRGVQFYTGAFLADLEKKAERILEIETLIGYKPRRKNELLHR